jgi:hypothetical protein
MGVGDAGTSAAPPAGTSQRAGQFHTPTDPIRVDLGAGIRDVAGDSGASGDVGAAVSSTGADAYDGAGSDSGAAGPEVAMASSDVAVPIGGVDTGAMAVGAPARPEACGTVGPSTRDAADPSPGWLDACAPEVPSCGGAAVVGASAPATGSPPRGIGTLATGVPDWMAAG